MAQSQESIGRDWLGRGRRTGNGCVSLLQNLHSTYTHAKKYKARSVGLGYAFDLFGCGGPQTSRSAVV